MSATDCCEYWRFCTSRSPGARFSRAGASHVKSAASSTVVMPSRNSTRRVVRSRTRASIASALASNSRASARKWLPAAVSATPPRSRSKRRAPTTSSSAWTCRVRGGWVIESRSAARRKLDSSATATKYLSCHSSMNAFGSM
ncbi:hypothetical protein BG61_20260 [Caballeronia glathei]|uniref:Uncharacterized protein n=1 Tax=Caballeronia glathei TaxID=60547 RepID=A0A069PMZ0_9BURK|nr:hypothetical protein BG61_20260 [Caballeronia glathei]